MPLNPENTSPSNGNTVLAGNLATAIQDYYASYADRPARDFTPITLLDSQTQSGESATDMLGVTSNVFERLGLGNTFIITQPQAIEEPDGRQGTSTSVPLPGGKLRLVLDEFPDREDQPAALRFGIAPVIREL